MATTTVPAPQPSTSARPRGVAAIAVVVVLGSVMSVLDMTVVNVALNHLSQDFDAPLATIQWVATGYTLALATVIPVAAWAMGRFGTKRLYMFSITTFAAGSVLAGLAWSAESLIAFRVVQGLGGGLIMPVGMTILARASDPSRMGRTMAILGIPILIGPLAGPILGGWLVDDVSWRWIFFINVPIGALALGLAARVFPRDTPQPTRPLDVIGLLMLSPGLALLIYGLATGGEKADFTGPGTLVPALLGALSVVAFVIRALRVEHPLIDLGLFRSRAFAAAAATMVLFVCAYFGSMMLAPMYYQLVRGESATASGLLGAPQAITTAVTMQFASRLSDRIAPGRIVLAGIVVGASGFLAFTTQVAADTPYWVLMGCLAVTGVGVGMTLMPTTASALREMSHEQVPVAGTTLTIVQQISAALGGALVSVLLAGAMRDNLPEGRGAGGLGELHSLSPTTVHEIAPRLADAFQSSYSWSVALMASAFLPALFMSRRRPATAIGPEAAQPVEPATPRPEEDRTNPAPTHV
ncbi:DHA2 family efflux MFS transporter permease subunit [Streptomyces sp. SID3343]|uniref:DHA2 family efflux MFS transporter permease subunit n=1 Tax=Streptomyces sp. SID3343 TaxID=2690260 RepID=UPI00136E1321|nr:DHA2 family efflux MFS transporter permease subunit [Streptomyces sp. SID3343]MYW01282.1 DHA2 family efflux MFS transporter permease subunit [Streptomyces sp. SID3343]